MLEECERAIQQADEILQYFARNSPQARRYRLILEKLSRAALDYVKRLEHKERAANNTLMPELFRLSSAETYTSNSSRTLATTRSSIRQHEQWTPPPRKSYSYTSEQQGSQDEPLEMNSGAFTGRSSFGQVGNAQTTNDTMLLLDLAHTFHSFNNPPLDMASDMVGGIISESMFDFENTESIWDLSWGGAML